MPVHCVFWHPTVARILTNSVNVVFGHKSGFKYKCRAQAGFGRQNKACLQLWFVQVLVSPWRRSLTRTCIWDAQCRQFKKPNWIEIYQRLWCLPSCITVVLKMGSAVLLRSARQFSGDREAPSKKINTTLLEKKFLCKIKFSGNLFFQTKLNIHNLELW